MNRTKIEWVRNEDGSAGYTWNPVTGCLNNCPYCYARKIATRFKGTKAWPNGFEPAIHWGRILQPWSPRKASKIFVCSMGELFGDWVPSKWIEAVMASVRCNPQHTFQFLTKYPWNLPKWNPWPENAWVGVTATDDASFRKALVELHWVEAPTKFISLEPFLSPIHENYSLQDLDWLIIGVQTNPYRPPQKEWVEEIIEVADRASIPVFLKENLRWPEKRQEFPRTGGKP